MLRRVTSGLTCCLQPLELLTVSLLGRFDLRGIIEYASRRLLFYCRLSWRAWCRGPGTGLWFTAALLVHLVAMFRRSVLFARLRRRRRTGAAGVFPLVPCKVPSWHLETRSRTSSSVCMLPLGGSGFLRYLVATVPKRESLQSGWVPWVGWCDDVPLLALALLA